MNNSLKKIIYELAIKYGIEPAVLAAIIEIEGSGSGFDPVTKKIMIQFEPYHFKRFTGIRVANQVEVQYREWIAFNEAFKINPKAAMLSTSWGIGQIMGFNFALLGFKTVDEMVDSFKKGVKYQIEGVCKFIISQPILRKAAKEKNFKGIASVYNGKHYAKLAKELGVKSYDIKLQESYSKHLNTF